MLLLVKTLSVSIMLRLNYDFGKFDADDIFFKEKSSVRKGAFLCLRDVFSGIKVGIG